MLARHPKTGAPIRILKAEGTVWRDSKTLVWLDGTENSSNWNRWDVGVSSIGAWEKVTAKGIKIDIFLLLGSDTAEANAWLSKGFFKTVRVIMISKTILNEIGYATLVEYGITNMLCLEETLGMYPFIETVWDKDSAYALTSARLISTMIMRYSRTFPVASTESPHVETAKRLGITVGETLLEPPRLYLVAQYYKSDKARRTNEIDLCLKKNIECPLVDRIILLNETKYTGPLFESSKVEQVVVGSRLRFDTVFKWIYDSAPPNTLIAVANSDIYLDTTFKLLWSITMKDKFLSLLRWDDQEDPSQPPKLFGPRADSQDSWIVLSDSVKERTWDWSTLNFPFGKGGCDNAINVEMLRKKFLIVNPCMSLITHHVHTSAYRTYDPKDIVDKPFYMHLQPTGIHDLKPEMVLPGVPFSTLTAEAVKPVLKGPLTFTQKETFHSILEKNGLAVSLPARSIPLYEYSDVMESYDGLLNTLTTVLIGPSKTASSAWAKKEVNIVAPCVDIDTALVAYCPDEIANNPYRYMLHYIGKILVLQGLSKTGEFIGVNSADMKEVLNLFRWQNHTIPVLARDPSLLAWCRKAYVWYPEDNALVTRAEVSALRQAFQFKWDSVADEHLRIVCFTDPIWITDAFVDGLEVPGVEIVKVMKGEAVLSIVEKLNGAWGVITVTGHELNSLLWLLPNGGHVWETQIEATPSVELLHLCDVADVEHDLTIMPRPKPYNDNERNIFLTNMTANIKLYRNKVKLAKPLATATEIPTVILPNQTEGFFAHSGDSFREMVAIWGERKYVNVKSADVCNVWLEGPKRVLLYDRPTLKWLEESKKSEQTWDIALFGNPTPPRAAKPWSFWPRRPRLVEELVGLGIPNRSYAERSLGTVFYGRSENSVQKHNRSIHDWSATCNEFVHILGTTVPYPYTQREYLERLSKAKWGLCLAGFGKKCHREIECMAMGCVPVVAPEVDMMSYANPPVEGVHYLRVEDPSKMKLLSMIPQEKWEEMSMACKAWWATNSSAKGLWELTKSLSA